MNDLLDAARAHVHAWALSMTNDSQVLVALDAALDRLPDPVAALEARERLIAVGKSAAKLDHDRYAAALRALAPFVLPADLPEFFGPRIS